MMTKTENTKNFALYQIVIRNERAPISGGAYKIFTKKIRLFVPEFAALSVMMFILKNCWFKT